MAKVEKTKVTVRNRSEARTYLTDVDGSAHEFQPGETKEIEVSEVTAEELEERSEKEDDCFELTTKAAAKKEAAKVEKLEDEADKAQAKADAAKAKAAGVK